ncbi:helix-turn-helix DNA binding domain protein [Gordonia phage Moosehead]|nr:helix-turn-helix DNA binding domain protein [Gordonia phage Moosehead]
MRLISKHAFREYMKFRGMTNESLAREAKCAVSTIAFLRSRGKAGRDSVGSDTAQRIERALNAPPGSLFSAQVIVASSISNKRGAA